MKKYLLLVALCLFAGQSFSQSVAQTRCDSLQKGINLSNWLEAYWEPTWPTAGTYTKDFLVEMKTAGMKSVRLPVCFDCITDTLPPYYVDTSSSVFALIDSVINWTSDLNMNLIIDHQPIFKLTDTSWRVATPRLAHLWSVLAQRYNYLNPDKYHFEIFNEPANIQNDSLKILYTTVIDTVRKYSPAHSIIVSGSSWSNGITYSSFTPLADTNLLYTFHSYDPFPFTHQGFNWVTPYITPGVLYPGDYDGLILVNWGYAMQWLNNYHLPFFLGEFGVGMYADENSRCNWIDSIGARIDLYHLSSFSWDVRGNFPLYKSGVVTRDSIIPCFSSALHLYENQFTVIEGVKEDLPFVIYPNPATETLNISFPENQKTQIQIFNAIGILLKEISATQPTAISIADLPSGFYFVRLKNNQQQVTRFVKQ